MTSTDLITIADMNIALGTIRNVVARSLGRGDLDMADQMIEDAYMDADDRLPRPEVVRVRDRYRAAVLAALDARGLALPDTLTGWLVDFAFMYGSGEPLRVGLSRDVAAMVELSVSAQSARIGSAFRTAAYEAGERAGG